MTTSGGEQRNWRARLTDPPFLFSLIALAVLVLIWTTTINLANRETAATARAGKSLAGDVADTYEAQVVRALREIDHTLKLVGYSLSSAAPGRVLADLRDNELLPPELLFTVNVLDPRGTLLATTHPANTAGHPDAAFLQLVAASGGMAVGLPRFADVTGEWRLHFGRAHRGDSGELAGVVTLSVHAGYFVSGYEFGVLGDGSVLGIIGVDGVFRARRTGNVVSAGEHIDYATLLPAEDDADAGAVLERNAWDDVSRFTVSRKLFEFPLAIVVGLSEAEHLAPARRRVTTYIERAALASAILLGVIAILAWVSWQLQRTRERAMNERVEHARRVEYLAYHDNLTDLPNRALFSRSLSAKMHEARLEDTGLALMFLDVDRFKNINDSLGHDAGDALLREVGRRLRGALDAEDIVARLGGDEFVVLLPGVRMAEEIVPVLDRLLSVLGRPMALADQEFRVSVSIGVTLFPGDGEDEQTLFKNADAAMRHAKEQGKNNFQFYSSGLSSDSLARLSLESSLRNALERDELCLFFQGKQDVASGAIVGVEALLRWRHPDLGLVYPMRFISLAEESGLIVPIGRWVLQKACEQNVAWINEGFAPICMAVNLSARQFLDRGLLEDVKGALESSGMEASMLELEITESMVMQDVGQAVRVLKELKAMGVKIAIDDFGTGYSSLSTLKLFPLDTFKIDRSFVRDVTSSAEDRSLIEAIIAVGKSLRLTVVAEGVETAEQARLLRDCGCDAIQGYFVNRPMARESFTGVLGARPVTGTSG